jgi:hypothetical protein
MVSGADPDPAMPAFGPAALHIAVAVCLISGLADTGGSCFESHPLNTGGLELLINVTAGLSIQVPDFAHYCFGDVLGQFTADELAVGVGQLKPQCPRRIEPACRRNG